MSQRDFDRFPVVEHLHELAIFGDGRLQGAHAENTLVQADFHAAVVVLPLGLFQHLSEEFFIFHSVVLILEFFLLCIKL